MATGHHFSVVVERETRNPPQFMFTHRPFLYLGSCPRLSFLVDSLVTHQSLLSLITLILPFLGPCQEIS